MEYKRCYARISLPAIRHNLQEVRKRIPKDGYLIAVIKANAYGHGSCRVAEYIDDIVDMFGVACLDEAQELRDAGAVKPILILGYTSPSQYGPMIINDISPSIYSFEEARKLSATASVLSHKVNIHIAIDSGMTRIGFRSSKESIETILEISRLPFINIAGIFTHLSCADMESEEAKKYTKMQIAEFTEVSDALRSAGLSIPIIHALNSAGIMQLDHKGFTGFRSGIITYGMYPSDEVDQDRLDLKPALSWYAHVINIAEVEPGRGVSYGATYVTDKPVTKIATVSAGYADGYPRALSNKGKVIINGKFAPIIGRVCMDQFMVDVTDIEDVKIEDKAVLIGSEGGLSITADDIAALEGTINYEITCKISPRVTKIYINR